MKLVSTKPLLIHVVGKPAPQGSKISTRFGMREASQFVAPWRNQVVCSCVQQKINNGKMITEPVKVEISFQFHRPKSHFGTGKNLNILKKSAPKYPTSKIIGDIDKLCRSTLDGLSVPSGGVLLEDDSLVMELHAHKIFVSKDATQGAWIYVSKLS